MRSTFFLGLGAILAILAAQVPASAKSPGGGNQNKGNGSQGTSAGSPSQQSANQSHPKHHPGDWDWRWYRGRGWYAPDGSYLVARPILDPIRIVNPPDTRATLRYTLNGSLFTIPPGYAQKLNSDREWVIQFSRGNGLGAARYSLEPGLYRFAGTDHGWELYRAELSTAPPLPPILAANPSTGQDGPPLAPPGATTAAPGQANQPPELPQPVNPAPGQVGQPPASAQPTSPAPTTPGSPPPAGATPPGSSAPVGSTPPDSTPPDSTPPGSGPF